MVKLLRRAWLVGGVVLLAVPAAAQKKPTTTALSGPKNELGVDAALQFISRPSPVGGGIQFAAPVDVRWGFLSTSRVNFEVRATLAYDSKGAGTAATLLFAPGVNALYQLKRGTGTRGLIRAPYLTGGLGLNMVQAGGLGTQTQFTIGGGVGTRLPAGALVVRPEGFLAYASSSGFLPHTFSIGVRVGLSFWH